MIRANRKLRITVVIVAGVAAMVGWWLTLAPQAVGGPNAYVVVATNAATPQFQSGDIVIIRKAKYHVGQVVVEISGSRSPALARVTGGTATQGWRLGTLVGPTTSPARVADDRILGSPWLVIGGYDWLHWVLVILAAAVAVALLLWPVWWHSPFFRIRHVRRPSTAERLSLQFVLPIAWLAFLGADYSFTDREAGINRISFAGSEVATRNLGNASLLALTLSLLAAAAFTGRLFVHPASDIAIHPEEMVDPVDTSLLNFDEPAQAYQPEVIDLTDDEIEQVIDLRILDLDDGAIPSRAPDEIQPPPPAAGDISTPS